MYRYTACHFRCDLYLELHRLTRPTLLSDQLNNICPVSLASGLSVVAAFTTPRNRGQGKTRRTVRVLTTERQTLVTGLSECFSRACDARTLPRYPWLRAQRWKTSAGSTPEGAVFHGVTVWMTAQPIATGAVEGKVCSTLAVIKGSVLVRWTFAWRSSAARSCGCYIRCRHALQVACVFLGAGFRARLASHNKLKPAHRYRWIGPHTVVQPWTSEHGRVPGNF